MPFSHGTGKKSVAIAIAKATDDYGLLENGPSRFSSYSWGNGTQVDGYGRPMSDSKSAGVRLRVVIIDKRASDGAAMRAVLPCFDPFAKSLRSRDTTASKTDGSGA
jgi:hypothetical protein